MGFGSRVEVGWGDSGAEFGYALLTLEVRGAFGKDRALQAGSMRLRHLFLFTIVVLCFLAAFLRTGPLDQQAPPSSVSFKSGLAEPQQPSRVEGHIPSREPRLQKSFASSSPAGPVESERGDRGAYLVGSGVVLNRAKEPLVDTQITMRFRDPGGNWERASTRTDTTGQFAFHSLQRGQSDVFYKAYPSDLLRIELNAAFGSTGLVLQATSQEGVLSGTVPVDELLTAHLHPSLLVVRWLPDGKPESETRYLDDSGQWSFRQLSLASGRLVLLHINPDVAVAHDLLLDLNEKPRQEVEFELLPFVWKRVTCELLDIENHPLGEGVRFFSPSGQELAACLEGPASTGRWIVLTHDSSLTVAPEGFFPVEVSSDPTEVSIVFAEQH